jgi:hypothetical protein
MEAEVEGLSEILGVERKRSEELRLKRARWASALEASQRPITNLTKAESVSGRRFLGWFRRSV